MGDNLEKRTAVSLGFGWVLLEDGHAAVIEPALFDLACMRRHGSPAYFNCKVFLISTIEALAQLDADNGVVSTHTDYAPALAEETQQAVWS